VGEPVVLHLEHRIELGRRESREQQFAISMATAAQLA
jgi:hypothetical protein